MKVLFEKQGATENVWGIHLHVREIISRHSKLFEQCGIFVAGVRHLHKKLTGNPNASRLHWLAEMRHYRASSRLFLTLLVALSKVASPNRVPDRGGACPALSAAITVCGRQLPLSICSASRVARVLGVSEHNSTRGTMLLITNSSWRGGQS